MENKSNFLFCDLIEIDLIRKKIFQKISSFNDICNLGKTCSQMDFIIKHDKIKKSFMCYEDKQIVEIKIKKKFQNDYNIYDLENIEYEKYNNSNGRIDKFKIFYGETICLKSSINCYIDDVVDDFEKNERLLFIKKLVNELNFNHKIRKRTKILTFTIDSFDNHDIILHMLSYICHNSVRRIEVPDSIFTTSKDKYDELNFNIFENLLKFHELVIYTTSSMDTYKKLLENKSIIDRILQHLAKKENITIILENLYHHQNKIKSYVEIFSEITKKYNIKLKCNVKYNCSGLFNRSCKNCLDKICTFDPIKEYVTSIKFENGNFANLLNIINNWQYFINLETLELSILNNDIKKWFEENNISIDSSLLKNCTKLQKVKLNLRSSLHEKNIIKIKEVHNNLVFLGSLMPNTVQVLELINIPDLDNDIGNLLNSFMKNIKILIMNRISFKSFDFLNNFKNLKCYVSNDNWIIEVPNTIQLLGIGHKNNERKYNHMPTNNEIINIYSKKYSKFLKSLNDQYIFFNDIKYWNIYKNLIQNI
uniref:Protein-serine/threonine phosphatase n=1 Tax=Strongyloides stercoralis TaxID=6248 RepID=A0A0K0EM00_STRER